MATVKCTKNEMHRLQKKLVQLKRYLPTLQLKKMLLQGEVNKAKEEIERNTCRYNEEVLALETSIKLLSDPSVELLKDQVIVEKKNLVYENIAGIELPMLVSLSFKKNEESLQHRPFWHADLVKHLQFAKKAFLTLQVSKEKKTILEEELRSVSIRVNLFEKRLIPGIERDICTIKIFLGDQVLALVSLSKLVKGKMEKKNHLEKENNYAS